MRQKGFTLIELMVTVIILSIGILGVMAALGNGVNDIRRIRDVSTAANVLQERMEIVRNTSFSGLSDVTWTDIDDSVGLNNGQWSLSVENYEGHTGIKRVTITASWTRGGGTVQKTLVTLVSRSGINP